MIIKILKNIWYKIHLDYQLFILLMILCSFGLFVLYSSTGGSLVMVGKQFLHIIIAVVIMLIIAQIPPYHLKRYTPYLMIVGVILLVLVLFFGSSSKGAQRWLDLGFLRFQPSEIMKIIVPIAIASILSETTLPPKSDKFLFSFVMILLITFLIAKQPDLGTALLIGCSGLFILFFSGLRWRVILSFLAIIVASLPIFWKFLLHPYQKQRILTFLNPDTDALGSGYHIIQSKIAIGSGGVFGKGWGLGTQSQLNFLPEHSTDFIFAVLAEELGFVGVILLFFLYGLIIYRCFKICINAQDNFSRLLTASLTFTFFIYIFVNVGMVTGLLPVVGIPLPFISYGGTSMVTIMASFGVLMSVKKYRRLV